MFGMGPVQALEPSHSEIIYVTKSELRLKVRKIKLHAMLQAVLLLTSVVVPGGIWNFSP